MFLVCCTARGGATTSLPGFCAGGGGATRGNGGDVGDLTGVVMAWLHGDGWEG